jgi:hypothetical protein
MSPSGSVSSLLSQHSHIKHKKMNSREKKGFGIESLMASTFLFRHTFPAFVACRTSAMVCCTSHPGSRKCPAFPVFEGLHQLICLLLLPRYYLKLSERDVRYGLYWNWLPPWILLEFEISHIAKILAVTLHLAPLFADVTCAPSYFALKTQDSIY